MQTTGSQTNRLQDDIGKRTRLGLKGDKSGRIQHSNPQPTPLVGSSNIVDLRINGHQMKALLDTGSMLSIIAGSKAANLGLPLQRVTDLVTVQGVGGQTLPYKGYVEADVELKEDSKETISTLLLVVEDTEYHKNVFILLGTNFLQVVWEKIQAERNSKDFTSWTPAWHITLTAVTRHKELRQMGQPLGQARCVQAVTVSPGQSVEIATCAKVTTTGMQSNVIMDDDDITVPGGLVLTPILLRVPPEATTLRQKVRLYNPTNKAVTVPAHTPLAHLQLADAVTSQSACRE